MWQFNQFWVSVASIWEGWSQRRRGFWEMMKDVKTLFQFAEMSVVSRLELVLDQCKQNIVTRIRQM